MRPRSKLAPAMQPKLSLQKRSPRASRRPKNQPAAVQMHARCSPASAVAKSRITHTSGPPGAAAPLVAKKHHAPPTPSNTKQLTNKTIGRPGHVRGPPDRRQRGARPGHGLDRRGQVRPPRPAPRRRRDGRGPLRPVHDLQPRRPAVGQPRPLRVVRGPRLDVPLLVAPPRGLRHPQGRGRELPPAPLGDARPPRVPELGAHDARHRGHDRPLGCGHFQLRGPRRGLQDVRRHVQHAGTHDLRQPHLLHGRRRLPPGGRLRGSLVLRRPREIGQPHRLVRRQRRHARQDGRVHAVRGRRRALRGLRLGRHHADRRPRPQGHLRGH